MSQTGYTVSRSNYSIKKVHKDTSKGLIYEKDYMATTNLSGFEGDGFPVSESNFKMVYREPSESQRAHNFGDCIKSPAGSCYWTLNNGAAKSEEVTTESKVVVKTSTESLLNFVYYGSCTELIKASIKDIINKFPGEIRTGEALNGVGDSTFKTEVLNPFNVDLFTQMLPSDEETSVDPLKYMYLSYTRYFLYINGEEFGCLVSFAVERNPDFCDTTSGWDKQVKLKSSDYPSEIIIRRYYLNGQAFYMTNFPFSFNIRPSQADFEDFYNNKLDDFERLLLNRDTNPKYTAYIDFPHETERGTETYKKYFTWPTDGDWNLDITSAYYENYVNGLLELATFYDENDCDNLWRMMTHDSIKNMDITFKNAEKDEDRDEYIEGMSNLRGLMLAYARQFDDIKRYADGVRSTSVISYDKDGNIPDYFLTDVLNNAGWEVTSAVSGLSKDGSFVDENTGKEYGLPEANIEFLKNLKLNSRAIFSRKGTRYGIEEILGLLGLVSDDFAGEGKGDYSIDEYYHLTKLNDTPYQVNAQITARPKCNVPSDELTDIEVYNQYNMLNETDIPEGEEVDTLAGLPAKVIYYDEVELVTECQNCGFQTYKTDSLSGHCPECGSTDLKIQARKKEFHKVCPECGREQTSSYAERCPICPTKPLLNTIMPRRMKTVIRWQKKASEIDGETYFEMAGGWQEETLNYLRVVNTIVDLTTIPDEQLQGKTSGSTDNYNGYGDLVYVTDISDFEDYFDTEETHYFFLLKKKVNSLDEESDSNFDKKILGDNGWLPVSDGNEMVENVKKIIEEYRGNNPHVGYGGYDYGRSYLKAYTNVFKYIQDKGYLSDNAYDCNGGYVEPRCPGFMFYGTDGEEYGGYETKITNTDDFLLKNNKKCHYFYDKDRINLRGGQEMKKLTENGSWGDYKGESMSMVANSEFSGTYSPIDVRTVVYNNNVNARACENTNGIYVEPSIMNSKVLKIKFRLKTDQIEEENFINETAIPYLLQIVPSTTLLKITLEKI